MNEETQHRQAEPARRSTIPAGVGLAARQLPRLMVMAMRIVEVWRLPYLQHTYPNQLAAIHRVSTH